MCLGDTYPIRVVKYLNLRLLDFGRADLSLTPRPANFGVYPPLNNAPRFEVLGSRTLYHHASICE